MNKCDDAMENVLIKLESIASDINSMKITLVKQEENIKLHIYRTELAEQNIQLLQTRLDPIENHINYVHGVLRFFGALSILTGMVLAVVQIIKDVS